MSFVLNALQISELRNVAGESGGYRSIEERPLKVMERYGFVAFKRNHGWSITVAGSKWLSKYDRFSRGGVT